MSKRHDTRPANNPDVELRSVTAYLQQGQLQQAAALATRILNRNPGHADTYHLLGIIRGMQGQYRQGSELISNAIRINPGKPGYFNNLGYLLHLDGELDKALHACERALQLNPKLAEAHNTRGVILKDLGCYDDALAACEQALQGRPAFAEALHTRSAILKELGRPGEALTACEQAIQIRPDLAEAHNTRSTILKDLGRLDQALAACERAIQLRPNLAEAHSNKGSLLFEMGYPDTALPACERAIQIDPSLTGAHYNRANILGNLCRYKEAEDEYREELRLHPADATAHSNLIFLLASLGELAPDRMLEELRNWDNIHGKDGRLNTFLPHGRTESGGRIRIGYVSPDFRTHPVSYFFEPLLAAHDHSRFEIFCYASHDRSRSDATTRRLECMADNWRHVGEHADRELAQLVYNDKIDILIDLAGHTRNNRLKTFTYKPAPVQATYLGFFGSSGLAAMDYWITDEVLHPTDTDEPATECIYRLPRCSFCYTPPADALAVASRRGATEHITFGSFNHLSKLTPEVIETWSTILGELPGSRLLVMDEYMKDRETRQRIHRHFARHGIQEDQVTLRGKLPHKQYLSSYAEIDIVLDTFPRTGGTSTADALWNGVPVITLAGQRYVERISASKLVSVGLEDLVAESHDDYIQKCLMLARNHDLRADMRAGLRERMQNSALCDGQSLASTMEDAYHQMWNNFISDSS